MKHLAYAAAGLALVAFATDAQARDQIRIVGSSTVFPFTTAVAENFGKKSGMATPVVESTGTGGGMKLFCAGVGENQPDFTNASRRIKDSEFEACSKAGVSEITEIKIGYDGIAFASEKSSPDYKLTRKDVWLALAKEVPVDGKMVPNPYTTWNQVNSTLPEIKIEVMGPPPTSGTRDSFVELVLDHGCAEFPEVAALESSVKTATCQTIREDGVFIEAGENDNLIVQKLRANPNAIGVFGYSFLDQNLDTLIGHEMDGKEPTYENIQSGAYPVSRSMYVYAKNAHAGVIPGMKEFITEYTSEAAFGDDGYLTDKGLIAMPADEREEVRKSAMAMTPLNLGS